MTENQTRTNALPADSPKYTIEIIRKPNGRGGFTMVSYKVAGVGIDPAQLIRNLNTLVQQLEATSHAQTS